MSDGSSRRGFLRDLAVAARDVRGAAGAAGAGRDAYAEAEAALLGGGPGEEVVAAAPPAGALTDEERERYARQLALPGWDEAAQLALRDASVLVLGAGALGSPVATYLAGAGIGRLGIADPAPTELGDLPRQHLHFTPDVGVPKAQSAAAKLGFLNPECEVVPYEVAFEPGVAAGLLEGHDLLVDASGSAAARSAATAACRAAGLPLVTGGVAGIAGFVMAIRPGRTACHSCAFPPPSPREGTPPAAGVLGPAAGVAGSLMALQALELLTGFRPPLLDALLSIDLGDLTVTRVPVARRPDCPDCGEG